MTRSSIWYWRSEKIGRFDVPLVRLYRDLYATNFMSLLQFTLEGRIEASFSEKMKLYRYLTLPTWRYNPGLVLAHYTIRLHFCRSSIKVGSYSIPLALRSALMLSRHLIFVGVLKVFVLLVLLPNPVWPLVSQAVCEHVPSIAILWLHLIYIIRIIISFCQLLISSLSLLVVRKSCVEPSFQRPSAFVHSPWLRSMFRLVRPLVV